MKLTYVTQHYMQTDKSIQVKLLFCILQENPYKPLLPFEENTDISICNTVYQYICEVNSMKYVTQ